MATDMSKLILTDCDGVLLSWEWAFRVWMEDRGYEMNGTAKQTYYLYQHYNDMTKTQMKDLVKQFNDSAAIGFLPAMRDSVQYVKQLHEEHGYRFRVITSLSLDPNAQRLREMNLRKLFGNAIESVICLDTGADKDQALAPYLNSNLWWIEDKFENFELGVKLGLRSILFEHGHNMNEDHAGGYKVVSWAEIYQLVTLNP